MTDGYKLIVGSLPDRKSKALSVQKGCVIWPVAYFRDEESYQRFCAAAQGGSRIVWEDGE